MNKLSYGNFDPNNADIAFSATNQYSSPTSELETRKQLSYPLKEVKTFINNSISVDSDDNVIQLVLSGGQLKYRTEPNGTLYDIGGGYDSIYPVGSIYMSVNNTDPSTLFPGSTWTLKSSVALASEHVFGNGYALGLSNGTNTASFGINSSGSVLANGTLGDAHSAAVGNGNNLNASKAFGVPTITELGANPEYSGLIADTITIYMWERTA